jgi:hypothetical protein
MKRLSASDLLAGSELVYDIELPAHLLAAGDLGAHESVGVQLKPLTVKDLQLINRAAKDQDQLTATLMVQTALVEPALSIAQVGNLSAGLMNFLLDEVNRISGISTAETELNSAAQDPLARSAFILAREFGWTPEQVSEMTLGQILLNLQLLKEQQA